MNAQINGAAGRAPARKTRRRRQDLDRPLQLVHLALELADLPRSLRAHPRRPPLIDGSLAQPLAQRLRAHPQPPGHRGNRRVLRSSCIPAVDKQLAGRAKDGHGPDPLLSTLECWTAETAADCLRAWSGSEGSRGEYLGDGLLLARMSAAELADPPTVLRLARALTAAYIG